MLRDSAHTPIVSLATPQPNAVAVMLQFHIQNLYIQVALVPHDHLQ